MPKMFCISWTEQVENECWVWIAAPTEAEALTEWNKLQFDDYDRDEVKVISRGEPKVIDKDEV